MVDWDADMEGWVARLREKEDQLEGLEKHDRTEHVVHAVFPTPADRKSTV